jgi:hypothetical protein
MDVEEWQDSDSVLPWLTRWNTKAAASSPNKRLTVQDFGDWTETCNNASCWNTDFNGWTTHDRWIAAYGNFYDYPWPEWGRENRIYIWKDLRNAAVKSGQMFIPTGDFYGCKLTGTGVFATPGASFRKASKVFSVYPPTYLTRMADYGSDSC